MFFLFQCTVQCASETDDAEQQYTVQVYKTCKLYHKRIEVPVLCPVVKTRVQHKICLLFNLRYTLCNSLSFLFTELFTDGVLPNVWLTSTVTPVFKKGLVSDPANYRPSVSEQFLNGTSAQNRLYSAIRVSE